MMRKFSMLSVAAVGVLAFSGLALAQGAPKFDGNKFFEEIANRGVNTKGIDGNKFFEDIANRGVNSKNPIDGNKFFEEMANRGVNTKGIDGNKFFEEMASRGVKMPDMVS